MQVKNEITFSAELDVHWGLDNSICAGLGLATCQDSTKVRGTFGPVFSFGAGFTNAWSDSSSVAIAYSYSYSTSSDPAYAGRLSDAFLTPSLNVKFSKSALVSFDPAACAGASKEVVTWSLDSESNVPVSSVANVVCATM
jgi:hypothetical protein